MKIKEFLQKLQIPRNSRWRGDCPVCGGNNTLSVGNEQGKLMYYCFKAQCNTKGNSSIEMSMDEIRSIKKIKENEPLLLKNCVGWDNNIKAYSAVMEYLINNNCMDAYKAYPNCFFYDKIKNRVVFVEYQGLNGFKLAIGRALDRSVPKWYKYISLPGAIFLQHPSCNAVNSAYIVEDCASACSISRVGWGVALCGTTYNIVPLVNAIKQIGMTNVVVALDKDAIGKALQLQNDLKAFGNFTSVKLAHLSDDAKYIELNNLKKELENV